MWWNPRMALVRRVDARRCVTMQGQSACHIGCPQRRRGQHCCRSAADGMEKAQRWDGCEVAAGSSQQRAMLGPPRRAECGGPPAGETYVSMSVSSAYCSGAAECKRRYVWHSSGVSEVDSRSVGPRQANVEHTQSDGTVVDDSAAQTRPASKQPHTPVHLRTTIIQPGHAAT